MSTLKIPRFDRARVLTIGDVMLDRYWQGETARVSPEAPIPVVSVTQIENRLGGAANVALNVSALGADAALIGAVGKDEAAGVIGAKLDSAGISHGLVGLTDYQTITKYRVMSQKQQLVRADFESTRQLDASAFEDSVARLALPGGVVVLSDYDKGVLADPQAFIRQLLNKDAKVLVDPKFKDFSAYAGATLIKPNQREFQHALGGWASEQELVRKCQTLMSNLGFEAVLVTRGSEGMTLVRKGQPEFHLPAHSHEVFDVSGAGDTVIAVLATALASGLGMIEAVSLANIAAGIVVTRLGTASVSGPELRLALVNEMDSNQGVLSQDQLLIAAEAVRAQGERIVFTNGCFDILHAGHVGYLAEARQLGDKLVVAVNDDASVARLKGAGRPINNLERRLAVLSGLSAVDWVVAFSGDTPLELIEGLRPEVLVKGGDYDISEVVGASIVEAYGGEVRVLKLVDGLSTTAIAARLHELNT